MKLTKQQVLEIIDVEDIEVSQEAMWSLSEVISEYNLMGAKDNNELAQLIVKQYNLLDTYFGTDDEDLKLSMSNDIMNNNHSLVNALVD